MQIQTVLLIILAAIVALVIVLFQYYYKNKPKGKLSLLLAFLRFSTFFCAFLLLINPKFTKNEYRTEKSNLIVLVDNSSSVGTYQKDVATIVDKLGESESLNNRFNVEKYTFGSSLKASDSLSFIEKSTDITNALSGLKEIYSATNSVVILISDGNQTLGQDYGFYGEKQNFTIYPIAVGDTTRYEDIAITQVNTNRYAFLKNKYPVELYVSYTGASNTKSEVKITVNDKSVFRQEVALSNTANTKIINAVLDANSVGLKNIVVSVGKLTNERNIENNKREVVVEVIDEKTNIGIISNIVHPDIGTLKKAIESNEQRSVSILKPGSNAKEWEDVDLFILYQPDPSFKTVYEYIQHKKANLFTITGTQTNWNFLNKVQTTFTKKSYNQTEEIFPVLNPAFGLFNSTDFSLLDFPPLQGNLGEIVLKGQAEVLLNQQIKGAVLNEPLLAVFKGDVQRQVVLFGENSWKWRIQSYRNDQSFKNFDDFVGKIILFLTVNKSRERLTLEYESVYMGSNEASISAAYFDETFAFDANAMLAMKLKSKDSETITEMPMLLKGNYYESDLSNLPAGRYDFTVSVKNEKLSKSGSFNILEFDVEKQFSSTDHYKLQRLAENTGGKLFYPPQTDDLLRNLEDNNRFVPTQKSSQKVVSLISFKILLAIMVAALAAEWFIRKYNGLI